MFRKRLGIDGPDAAPSEVVPEEQTIWGWRADVAGKWSETRSTRFELKRGAGPTVALTSGVIG